MPPVECGAGTLHTPAPPSPSDADHTLNFTRLGVLGVASFSAAAPVAASAAAGATAGSAEGATAATWRERKPSAASAADALTFCAMRAKRDPAGAAVAAAWPSAASPFVSSAAHKARQTDRLCEAMHPTHCDVVFVVPVEV